MDHYMKGDIWISDGAKKFYTSPDAVLTGTAKKDTMILVQAIHNTIYAGAGDDRISLSSGTSNNLVYAESGNDFIGTCHAVRPTIYGGSGDDTIRVTSDNIYAEGGDDNDRFILLNSTKGTTLKGGNGDDTFWFIESSTVTLSGGSGNNTYWFDPYYLFGPYRNNVVITDISSNDTIKNYGEGTDGSELVISKSGNDVILKDSESGYGNFNITLKGGMNNLNSLSKVAYKAWDGQTTLGERFPDFFREDDDADADADSDSDADAVKLSKNDKLATLTENYDEDEFRAANYSSKIVTIDASDVEDEIAIYGNSKANKIIAGDGDALLSGGGGKDTLIGGEGDDTLTGGAGKDVFVHTAGDDIITDYATKDSIKLEDTEIEGWKISGKNVIFTTTDGTLTVKNGKGKKITIIDDEGDKTTKKYSASSSALFAEDNFVTADNISDIVENKIAVAEFENYNSEKLTQENLITYTDK